MSNLKLLRTILRLKSLKITDFRFLQRGTELHLAVKPYKNGCRCPECGRRGRIVHQPAEPRRWEDVAVLGLRLVLWYAPKEIRCPTHGRVQEEIPWAPASARVTYRLEWRLCALCQVMTQTAAAEILRLPTPLFRTAHLGASPRLSPPDPLVNNRGGGPEPVIRPVGPLQRPSRPTAGEPAAPMTPKVVTDPAPHPSDEYRPGTARSAIGHRHTE